MFELVSLSDCMDIAVGGEDEMINLIDSRHEEKGLWAHRADLENWEDDFSSDFEEV
jgi:hypothetical protein